MAVIKYCFRRDFTAERKTHTQSGGAYKKKEEKSTANSIYIMFYSLNETVWWDIYKAVVLYNTHCHGYIL